MKKVCLIIIAFCIININVCAYGVDDVLNDEMQDNIINSFEASGIECDAIELIDKLNQGEFNVGFKEAGKYIKTLLVNLLKENIGFGLTAFVLIILASMIENVKFGESNAVNVIVLSIVSLSLVGVVNKVSEGTVQFIDNLMLFVNSYTPTLMMLLATSGKAVTTGILNPVMIAVSSIIVIIVKNFLIPLNIISFVLKLTGCITQKNHLTNFGEQIQKILKWSLGLMVTLYVGIVAIIGVSAPKIDAMSIKTAKYAISNFVPYVGGMVADSVELILACSSVVKNSTGIVGLIGVLILAIGPCVNVLIKMLVLNLLSFFAAPVARKNTIESINSVSSCVGIFFAVNIMVAVMYIISVTVIIFIGGA